MPAFRSCWTDSGAGGGGSGIGYRVSSALRPQAGEQLCGDQVEQFEVGDGVYLLLCDGMGSGQEAHREAAMTAGCCGGFWRRVSSRGRR